MRHNKKFNHLGRKSAHRKSLLSNLASSLIKHKRITTTLAKAKELRVYVEPILTKSKEDTTHSRRQVFALLQNKEVVTELFQNISQKIADRPGGYTRILRTGFRLGDAAEMCIIELVDYNENMLKEKATKKASARTRRSTKKTAMEEPVTTKKVVAESVAIKPEEVEPVVEQLKPSVEETHSEILAQAEELTEATEPTAEDKIV